MTSTKLTSTPASASFIDVEKTPSVSEVSTPESQMASRPGNLQNCPDVIFEEAVFCQEEAEESDGEEAEVANPAVGQKKIVNEADIDALCSTPTCIVFLDQLLALADMKVSTCQICGSKDIEMQESFNGSAAIIEWVCQAKRPQNYTLVLPTNTGQRGFLHPLWQQLWKDETLGRHVATEVSISHKVLLNSAYIPCAFCGPILVDQPTRPVPISSWKGCRDGRNDSPDHSAQYC
ncbi:hypothetical protein MAR_021162 [Mya arenaria]|uniref:Uncharacterized protein n=1 Tax=Mya arenaria TaxID=6604 RepID=A0ABY7E6X2_MYAAR|nr:hypothetical protein MAR_021162 [Mya arenaria]